MVGFDGGDNIGQGIACHDILIRLRERLQRQLSGNLHLKVSEAAHMEQLAEAGDRSSAGVGGFSQLFDSHLNHPLRMF
ncbi:hypothetical protein D3C71_2013510 [compost metagenome]